MKKYMPLFEEFLEASEETTLGTYAAGAAEYLINYLSDKDKSNANQISNSFEDYNNGYITAFELLGMVAKAAQNYVNSLPDQYDPNL